MVAYLFELSYTGVIVTLLVLYLRFIASFSTKKRFFASYLFGFAVNVYGLSWFSCYVMGE
jgi:apolipoprotein N-acyltransferase